MAHTVEVRTPLVDGWLVRKLVAPPAAAKPLPAMACLPTAPRRPVPLELPTAPGTTSPPPISDWQQGCGGARVCGNVPTLARPDGPWARRWGYMASQTEGGE